MQQRIAIVFTVTSHASPQHSFSEAPSHMSCAWHDVLLNRESNGFCQKSIGHNEEVINHFLKLVFIVCLHIWGQYMDPTCTSSKNHQIFHR